MSTTDVQWPYHFLKADDGPARSKPTSKNETYVERTEPQSYASWQDNFQAVKQQVGSTGLSTELPSHIDAEPGGEPGKNQTAKQSKKDAPNTKNMCHGPGKGRGCTQSTTPKHTLSIASLKVKNFKTNLNFVEELSNTHKILLLQEHWLYGFETAILEKIYDNCDYLVKCVDDADPILPVQPPRGYAGIGILWHKDLNHLITAIPDGSDRIAAVEIATPEDKLCLIVFTCMQGVPQTVILASCRSWTNFTKLLKSLDQHIG